MGTVGGKSLIITGGGSGIGRATALLCARNGGLVTIGDVNEKGSAETVDMIIDAGGQAQCIPTDIRHEDDVRALIDGAVEKFGRLDGAFNNSGVPNVGKKLADVTVDEWRRVHDVNLLGTFLCMKYEIIAMLKTGGGTIVNAASAAGLVGFPHGGDYVASKHGVVGLTKGGAVDYGKENIRINAIAPGACRTEMFEKSLSDNPDLEEYFMSLHPIGRFSVPPEMAEAAMWLLSDASSFVHGVCLPVDGGYTAI